MAEHYDLIVAGTSFAGSFFLEGYLRRFGPRRPRVLVLERGAREEHEWRVATNRFAGLTEAEVIVNRTPAKPWATHITFGGCSNTWWACTPRFLPNDFRMRSTYGVGRDWPLGYDDLEPYYELAEQRLQVAGAADAPYPRRGPCPLPPHLLSQPEQALRKAYPDQFFPLPAARWSLPLDDPPRAQCCAAGRCGICPVDAKFTVQNSMAELYRTPGVTLKLRCPVLTVETRGNLASGVTYYDEVAGREGAASGDLIVLGANAIMNPFLMLRSGIEHPVLGTGLGEQHGVFVRARLRGMKAFGGSSSLTGHGYMLYDGDHRRDRAAALLEVSNVPERFRLERGRWLEVLNMKAIFEVLPEERNRVGIAEPGGRTPGDLGKPFTSHEVIGEYTHRAVRRLREDLDRLLAPLPVEAIDILDPAPTESHITGTTPMGTDPATSVVDADLVCHAYRNLLLPGSGVFPTTPPANPTLTLCALSLRAADRL